MGSGKERQDHYDVLGVTSNAPDEVIRAAYEALEKKYAHDPQADRKRRRVVAAFRVLGDPEKRRQYDELTESPASEREPPPKRAAEETSTAVVETAAAVVAEAPVTRTPEKAPEAIDPEATRRRNLEKMAAAAGTVCKRCGALNDRSARTCASCNRSLGASAARRDNVVDVDDDAEDVEDDEDDEEESEPRRVTQKEMPVSDSTRLLFAGSAVCASLVLHFVFPHHSALSDANPGASMVGMFVGLVLLALFVYWVAGKLPPIVTLIGIIGFAAIAWAVQADAPPDARTTATAATTTNNETPPAPTATATAHHAAHDLDPGRRDGTTTLYGLDDNKPVEVEDAKLTKVLLGGKYGTYATTVPVKAGGRLYAVPTTELAAFSQRMGGAIQVLSQVQHTKLDADGVPTAGRCVAPYVSSDGTCVQP